MTEFAFTVRGTPKPQPRPKARAIPATSNGRPIIKRGRPVFTAQVYDPHDADEWKAAVRASAERSGVRMPPGPVRVDLTIYIARPAYLCKKGVHPGPIRAWKRGTGDNDNFEKGTWDAMTRAQVFDDDSQISENRTSKWYHAIGAAPGAVVEVSALSEIPLLFTE